ncbi:HAD family hydrolase [Actinomyces polynesiensis]|uniref:HAD family hydrolase n=1 Tax=Actinomyces polynesiensis TaxID=1325934 RepID=UPI0005BDED0B|nr:HAD family hydrolase [Actinomyces polynesiensis]
MPPRLVCVDIDGTLINARQEVPRSSRDAIRAGLGAGNVFVLCTGRSLPEVYPWVWDLGFTGIIGGSGAFTRMGEEVVEDHRISHEDLVAVSSHFEDEGLPWVWQTPTEMHPSRSFMEIFAGDPAQGDTDWGPYAEQVRHALRPGLPTTASKGTFVVPDGTTFDPGVPGAMTDGRLRTISGSVEASGGTTCEVLISGVDKGTALVGLAQHLGIPVSETVAIGDSVNDLEALAAAGTGVAMGNASPDVKAVADLVTDGIDSDGLAKALDGLGLTGRATLD